MSQPELRPLTAEDAPATVGLVVEAFSAADRAAGREPEELTDERRASLEARAARFPRTDGPGCWAVDGDEGLIGVAVAIRRGPLWGLALLFVHPGHQSRRLGSRLLAATRAYAEGATLEVIMASGDHRAIRRYASLGLVLHPGMAAKGAVDRSRLPADLPVRDGGPGDLDLVDAVDRELRGGSSRADDVAFLLERDAGLLVADGAGRRGYVVVSGGNPVCLGATDSRTASELLWAALGHAESDVELYGLTGEQQWAFDVALAAGLQLSPAGPMFWRGSPALPSPYLPSGVYF